MEEAIEIDQSIQEIASEVKETAQQATQLAIATSEQAQASAEKTQQAIEATFAAAERAFEAAKNAGYSIDTDSAESITSEEVDQKLQAIKDKNSHLKSVNVSLKKRIAGIKS